MAEQEIFVQAEKTVLDVNDVIDEISLEGLKGAVAGCFGAAEDVRQLEPIRFLRRASNTPCLGAACAALSRR